MSKVKLYAVEVIGEQTEEKPFLGNLLAVLYADYRKQMDAAEIEIKMLRIQRNENTTNERERAQKLVEALKAILSDCSMPSGFEGVGSFVNYDFIEQGTKALSEYESKDFILDQEKGEL
jgi:hypothetical protein